jgi:hypothetical protein
MPFSIFLLARLSGNCDRRSAHGKLAASLGGNEMDFVMGPRPRALRALIALVILIGLSFTGIASAAPSASVAVTPEDFGAHGDGVYNDTWALELALATGRPVKLGSNRVYRIHRRLDLMDGGVIYSDDGTATILLGSRDGEFDNYNPDYSRGKNAVGIMALHVNNVVLRNFRIRKEFRDGTYVKAVSINGSVNPTVDGLDIAGFTGGEGLLSLNGVSGGQIINNRIHDCYTNVTYRSQITGIDVDDVRYDVGASSNVLISGNQIWNLTVGPDFDAIYGYETDGINPQYYGTVGLIIENNTIWNVGEGIDMYASNSVIRNNDISNAVEWGIKLIHGASGNLVENNQIDTAGYAGIVLAGSDRVPQDTADNHIVGNSISNAGADTVLEPTNHRFPAELASGIFILGEEGEPQFVRRTDIHDNVITDGAAMPYVVYCRLGSDNSFVDNSASSWETAYSYDTCQRTTIVP